MYLLKRFLGSRCGRINAIIDQLLVQLERSINLIASASYPFPEVLEALSYPTECFPLEGMPGARYFPGTGPADAIEEYGSECFRKLLKIDSDFDITLQPHSGTQANQVVYNAVLRDGDTVLSLDPSHGGHISHTVLVGRHNRVTHFRLTDTGSLDYDSVAALARAHRPRLIIAGTSSYPRPLNYERLGEIAREVGAYLHADASHMALFIMTGHHPPALPAADFMSFNPMKNLRGPSGGILAFRTPLRSSVARALFPGTQGGPLTNIMLAKALAGHLLLQEDLHAYAAKIIANAKTLAETMSRNGVRLVTGGTDSHIVLADLTLTPRTGLDVERLLESRAVLANRNLVPSDCRAPRVASGIRFGVTCLTILGYARHDIEIIAREAARTIIEGVCPQQHVIEDLLQRYQQGLSGANAERELRARADGHHRHQSP